MLAALVVQQHCVKLGCRELHITVGIFGLVLCAVQRLRKSVSQKYNGWTKKSATLLIPYPYPYPYIEWYVRCALGASLGQPAPLGGGNFYFTSSSLASTAGGGILQISLSPHAAPPLMARLPACLEARRL